MTINQIVESGMNFGPYPKGHCFFIEKSPTYKKIQNNVQIAEFLLLHYAKDGSPVVWVVEAKSSTPRPATPLSVNIEVASTEETNEQIFKSS